MQTVFIVCQFQKNWGIAIKVDDGKMGPQYQVAHGLLSALGLLLPQDIEALKSHGYCENFNFAGNSVGYSTLVPLNPPCKLGYFPDIIKLIEISILSN